MKKAIAIVIPVLVLGGLVAWRISVKRADAADLAKSQQARKGGAATVVLGKAEPKEIVSILESVGTVESPYNVKLSSKVTGRIDFLEAREGTPVKVGQVLVRIDPSQVEAQVLQAQANVAEARSRLAQAQLGAGPNMVGVTSGIRQNLATVSSAEADYEQVSVNYSSQVAAAEASVTDADARVASAQAGIETASSDVQSAQANLENAQARYQRTNNLYKQGFIAAQDVDDARTTVKVQQNAVNSAKNRLEAARSALASAKATRNAAANQASIVRRKGIADIAASKAKLNQARAGLASANANKSQVPAYAANIAALRSSVDAALAQLRQAQSSRADTTITSPLEGVVTARSMDPGMIATPSQSILTVQYLKWVYVTCGVPIEQSPYLKPGMTANIKLDALPDKAISGVITEVNPSADPQSRQFTVRVKLDNPQGVIRPGMYARLNLVTQRVNAAVVVPREAVKDTPKGKIVVTVDADMTAHQVPVTVGASDVKNIQIVSGLQGGEQVVVLSYQNLRDGQKVKVSASSGGGKGTGKRRSQP